MESAVKHEKINECSENQRLDNFLIKKLKGVPKSHIYKLIRSGAVRVNKKRCKPETKLLLNDDVRIPPVRVSEQKHIYVSDSKIELVKKSIIFENNEFLVINKPYALAVHGGSGNNVGLIEIIRQISPIYKQAELVHRLDRDTSGCILIAKKRSMLKTLQALIATHKISKKYWAILSGSWKQKKYSKFVCL